MASFKGREIWLDTPGCDINFEKETPYLTENSLHVYEERFKIGEDIYRLLYPIGDEISSPIIEKLKQ